MATKSERMLSRKELMRNLFAKALCRVNGNNQIQNNYAETKLFQDYKGAIYSITHRKVVLSTHFIDEDQDFDMLKGALMAIYGQQFGRRKNVYFIRDAKGLLEIVVWSPEEYEDYQEAKNEILNDPHVNHGI